jgi:hypothetical protein
VNKADYVRAQGQDRDNACHWPGQEKDMNPSEDYLAAAGDVQRWIREHGGPA